MRTSRSLAVSRRIGWGVGWGRGLPKTPDADPPGCRPPMDRTTDAGENITLPQTSFAGGKNKSIL